jgi:hypothetical protein
MRQRFLARLSFYFVLSATALAQSTFNSGSTGADGAFAPTQNTNIQVPDSGVFNYTTVTIPAGVTITYTPNSRNTPLTILASGDVAIAGTISVDGQQGNPIFQGGLGGPGGFRGGAGGANGNPASIGEGPGGGGRGGTPSCFPGGAGGSYASSGSGGNYSGSNPPVGGSLYGSRSLIPLIGGSGGGGGCALNLNGGGGGGGGGAILIASSGKISFSGSGTVSSRGGVGATAISSGGAGGGGGSGGGIRLIANTITGTATLSASGGTGGLGNTSGGIPYSGGPGGLGYVRLEAFSFTGFTNTAGISIAMAFPGLLIPTNPPTLQIASVAGVAAPANPVGSFQGSPDIVLPANQSNPVAVVINSANIPSGTTVNLVATSPNGTNTTASATLSGTTASSSGSASISLGSGLSVLTATAVIDLATISKLTPMFMNGEKVDKIEVAAVFGGGSEVTYITERGRRIRGIQ